MRAAKTGRTAGNKIPTETRHARSLPRRGLIEKNVDATAPCDSDDAVHVSEIHAKDIHGYRPVEATALRNRSNAGNVAPSSDFFFFVKHKCILALNLTDATLTVRKRF